MTKRFDDKARRHERREDKRESDVVTLALRLVEHLLATDHAVDAIERTVVGWMQARSLAPQDSHAVVARLQARLGNATFVRTDDGLATWRRRAMQDQVPSVGSGRVTAPFRTDTHAARAARIDGVVATERRHLDAIPARWRLPARDMGMVTGAVVPMESRQPGIYAIQRAPRDATSPDRERLRDVSPDAILKRLGGGRPLPERLREALQPRLEALGQPVDLARVRVHDDVAAETLCAELGAEAFAVLHHVVMAGPIGEDAESVATLAHELTHVWQQLRGDAPAGVDAHAHLETRAEAAAAALRREPLFSGAPTVAGETDAQAVAAEGAAGAGQELPFREQIQASFGRFDVSGARAHLGADARKASETLGAQAYATGSEVVFGETPSLFTAAHEAAHVVQQRSGVAVEGGLGRVGDVYEQHADRVAAAVIAGRPAEPILAEMAGSTGRAQPAVQLQAAAAPAATTAAPAETTDAPAQTPAPATEAPATEEAPVDLLGAQTTWRERSGTPWDAIKRSQDLILTKHKTPKPAFATLHREIKTLPAEEQNARIDQVKDLLITDERIAQEQKCEGADGYPVAKPDKQAERAVAGLMTEVTRQISGVPEDQKWVRKHKIKIGVVGTSFRPLDRQVGLFPKNVWKRKSVAEAQRYSALPGYSQHHTGKAFDVVSSESVDWGIKDPTKTAAPATKVDLMTGPIANKLKTLAPKFGGKVSYPEQDNNGRAWEPWHLYFENPKPAGDGPQTEPPNPAGAGAQTEPPNPAGAGAQTETPKPEATSQNDVVEFEQVAESDEEARA